MAANAATDIQGHWAAEQEGDDMTRTAAVLILALGTASCGRDSPDPATCSTSAAEVALTGFGVHLTSFVGWSKRDLTIDGAQLVLSVDQFTTGSAESSATYRGDLTTDGTAGLSAAAAELTVGATYGCPGCADDAVCLVYVVDSCGVASAHRYNCHDTTGVPATVQAVQAILEPVITALEACQPNASENPSSPCPWQ